MSILNLVGLIQRTFVRHDGGNYGREASILLESMNNIIARSGMSFRVGQVVGNIWGGTMRTETNR